MDISVLGPLSVSNGTRPVELAGVRQRRLLAAFAAHLGQVVSTDRLADIVFEGEPSERAATTIRSYVARLRRTLSTPELAGSDVILTEAPGYVLRIDESHVDSLRFLAAIASGRALLADRDAVGASSLLQQALELWRGDAYEEFAGEAWVQAVAARLDEERINAEEELVEALLACGQNDEVVPRLRRLATEHPLRERPRRQLMLALYRAGRQAEALRVFQEYRATLVDVALEPSGDLVAVDRQIAVQDPALQLASPAGRSLRGYRLGAALGQGFHGLVFRGVQPGVGREVAVKTIRPELADDPGFVRRFDAEARTVSRLEHPHIVPIYDFWREPGGAYLVMRLLDGDLSTQLREGPMSIGEVAATVTQLGSALIAAHRVSVVHGDIKPTNVLVDSELNVYLSDFGVATYGAHPDRLPSGSSGYESPEQLAGHPVTEASDQYGFAVLIAHALTGTLPFGQRAIASPHDRVGSVHLRRPSVPVEVDAVLERATAWEPPDRYPSVSGFVDDVLVALGHAPPRSPAAIEVENPYVGLRPFDESDADVFFGRRVVVDDLLDRLGRDGPNSRFVALVGASGCGKSSIVRAGLLPRLRAGGLEGSDEWFITMMTPGDDPVAALHASLRSIATGPRPDPSELDEDVAVDRLVDAVVPEGGTVLLVVDQFEELFTTVTDEAKRRAFVTGLVRAVTRSDLDARVVVTLRADFFDRPLRYHDLGELLKDSAVVVAGLSAAELDEAVRGPAATVGLDVEVALGSELIADVVDQPAALPLLQFTLTELFERRAGRTLTLASYRDIGGVDAAVAGCAEALYAQLNDEDRALVRRLFLRLITVDDHGIPTRRRVLRSDLVSGSHEPDRISAVLDRFAAARLLTFDRDESTRSPTVEVAHEALITQWPQLRSWVDEAGERIRIQSHLAGASATWDERGRDDSDLFRGSRLDEALALAADPDSTTSDAEREFLEASTQRRRLERAAERDSADRDRRANRRLRAQLAVLAVVLVGAVVAGLVAVDQRNSSRAQTSVGRARELAAASSAAVERDPELALLLAIEAAEVVDDPVLPEAEQALHDALAESRAIERIPAAPNGIAAFYPDGDAFLASGDEQTTAAVWGGDPIERRFDVVGHQAPIHDGEVSADGRHLATTSADGTLRLWDANSGEAIHVIEVGERGPAVPAFSNDGTRIAATAWWEEPGSPTARVWSVATGEELRSFPAPPGTLDPLNLEFSPDDTLLAVTYRTDEGVEPGVRSWDLASGELAQIYPGHTGRVTDVAFTPDGATLVSTSEDGTANVYDVSTGAVLRTYGGHDGPLRDIEISADGKLVATSGFDVQLWDLDTLEQLEITIAHGRADGLDISPDGDRLLTSSSFDTSVLLWDITPHGAHESAVFPGPRATISTTFDEDFIAPGGVSYSPDGATLGAADDRGAVTLWDLETQTVRTRTSALGSPVVAVSFSSDGSKLAVAAFDAIEVWSMEADERIARFESDALITDLRFLPGSDEELLVSGVFGVEVWQLDGSSRPLSTTRSLVAVSANDGQSVLVPEPLSLVSATTGQVVAAATVGDTFNRPDSVPAAAFDPAGRALAVAETRGDQTQVYLRRTDAALTTFDELPGHAGTVWDVAFSPTGPRLATLDGQGVIRIWDLENLSLRVLLDSPGGTDIDYSPDGRTLAVVGTDGATVVYMLDNEDLIAEAQRRLTRTWTEAECARYRIARCAAGD